MRDAQGFAPPGQQESLRESVQDAAQLRPAARTRRIAPVLLLFVLLAALAVYVVPRGVDAQYLLSIEDDPAEIAGRALDEKFNAEVATREIEQALAAKDSDLAKSFVDLAADRKVAIDPALTDKVNAAVAEDASAGHAAQSFALGLVTGEPNDIAGFAGTTLGDLFVFGDIRDAVHEGSRLASGQEADELILGLACVGLAITAGTYATLGAAGPARVGLSLAKVARKTSRISADLTAYIGRSLRGVVDWSQLKTAIGGFSIAQPALAIRAARNAVKVERAGGLMRLARDTGRVQAKAGTQAALDGLKIAQSPREMARVATLAEKAGSRTRAILKVAGRGAIALTMAVFDLGMWILWALATLFGLVSSLKGATERTTQRVIDYRKRRRLRRLAEMQVRA
ncbi:MAG: hypothetical protein Q8M24_05570 [Pseudolabrys sp.]|nr:hypothetical protein [Pseudolabrys sp.]MDP2294915.1 hypothetical protein [Pseudolabrys sp.]